ncbi:MPN527 family putative ECF transporter permease subunit [Mesomycoplasma molare]|uniref:ECF transporter S component n=1 Tax=Mesomycoplasma molare TaxID=171288 RepID=A0ABY5TUU8_9BACT|nr:ECF transporter S component [Mesomycoplasma molare]UWD34427.1 ECF transporter S component [Mesomycoplasma molare]
MKINNSYKNNTVYNLVLSAIFSSLSLIALFISQYLIWPGEFGLKIDLSLIFIFPVFFVINFKYGFITIFLRFILGPFLQGNIDLTNYLGHFILFLSNLIYILSFFLFCKVFKNKKLTPFVLTIIVTTTILSLLNFSLFIPLYFYLFKVISHFSIQELIEKFYGNNIWKYLIFVLITFGTFNLTNYSLSSVFIILLLFILKKVKSKNTK